MDGLEWPKKKAQGAEPPVLLKEFIKLLNV
jgi:hypothetical protein